MQTPEREDRMRRFISPAGLSRGRRAFRAIRPWASAAMLGLVMASGSLPLPAQQPSEVDQLRATVDALQKTVQEAVRELNARAATVESLRTTVEALKARIVVLEQEKPPQGQVPAGPSDAGVAAGPQSQPALPPVPAAAMSQTRSQVPDYQNFTEPQSSAPRPNNVPLVPESKGFIPIPGTQSMIRFGGVARVDAIKNFGNNGNPNDFTPSSFPVQGQPGFGGTDQFGLQAKGTRLSFEILRPLPKDGNLKIYYENDFFGDSSSPTMTYRLRHFYGQSKNFLVGQTYTVFMNVDAWPDILDYQGPNANVNLRLPQVRLIATLSEHQHMNFSFEQPNSQIATLGEGFPAGASPVNRYPDFACNYRYEGSGGHLQVAGLARSLGYGTSEGQGQSVIGWGVSLSGAIGLPCRDRLSGQIAYGQGMARAIKDTAGLNLDASLDGQGRLRAIPIFAPMIGYTHNWTGTLRSSATYGYVRVDPLSSMGGSALRRTQYAGINFMWHPTRSARMGLEYLCGRKETQDGSTGTANRLSFVIKYDLIK